MSGYRGRTGPNFSEYLNNLNNLNALSCDQEPLAQNDLSLSNDELAMFTNADFTDFEVPSLAENDGLNFDMDHSPIDAAAYYGQYNAPIQLAPATGFSVAGAQLPVNATSPDPSGSSLSLKRKADAASPSTLSPEEQSRVAAEEDKRRRNTAASARFRVKKKQREQKLEKTVKDANEKNSKLESRITQLEMENKWLRGLITEKNGARSKKELAEAYQQFRKDSEEREVKAEHKDGVGTR